MKRSRATEDDEGSVFSAGTDLVMGLMALTLILWAFAYREWRVAEGKVGVLETQLGSAAEKATQYEQMLDEEAVYRKKLLDLHGQLRSVVFVIDRSGSMGTVIENGGKIRIWDFVAEEVERWLRYLPVDEAALVLFNHGIQRFPNDGTMLPVNEETRAQFADYFQKTEPEGDTATLTALETAYEYPNVDTIILFTDGKPDPPVSSARFTSLLDRMRISRPGICINTVGLGKYYDDEKTVELLKLLADQTGGSFRAR